MAAQSAVMGEAFGKHYQYGKRKISSMTNEEFNKMDGGDIFGSIVTDYVKIIPQIERAMEASQKFQDKVITEIIKIVPRLPGAIVEGLTGGDDEEKITGQLSGIPSYLLPALKLLAAQEQEKLKIAKKDLGPFGLNEVALINELMKYKYTRRQAEVLAKRVENRGITAQEVQSRFSKRLTVITKTVTKGKIPKTKSDKQKMFDTMGNLKRKITRSISGRNLEFSRLTANYTLLKRVSGQVQTLQVRRRIREAQVYIRRVDNEIILFKSQLKALTRRYNAIR